METTRMDPYRKKIAQDIEFYENEVALWSSALRGSHEDSHHALKQRIAAAQEVVDALKNYLNAPA
jgi:hypothetical protein